MTQQLDTCEPGDRISLCHGLAWPGQRAAPEPNAIALTIGARPALPSARHVLGDSETTGLLERCPMLDPVASLASLMAEKGRRRYGLHDVSQLQHALQAALLAEQAGGDAALITAALLHDIGHMVHGLGENPADEGVDDRHEALGYEFLRQHFGPDVTDPVRLHVAAKRYLCAVEPDYAALLSPDSVLSLRLQGGPMSSAEVTAFRTEPGADAAVRLRRFDDQAKTKDLPTPPLAHFLPFVARCLAAAPGGPPTA